MVYDEECLYVPHKNNFLQSGTSQDGALDDETNLHVLQCEHHTMHALYYAAQAAKKLEVKALKSKMQKYNFSSLLN